MLNCIKGVILSQDRVKPLPADPSGIYHARFSCHLKTTVQKVLLTKETRSLAVRTSTTKQESFIQQTERAAAFFPLNLGKSYHVLNATQTLSVYLLYTKSAKNKIMSRSNFVKNPEKRRALGRS